MSKKTTLIQISKAADVSISTVDRVLNQRGGVSPDKEKKVLEMASQLNLDRVIFRNYLKVLRVAVMMQSSQNPFYRGLRNAFLQPGAVLSDMKINCFIHDIDVTDSTGTTRKIREISENYDALIVICPDDPHLSDELQLISTRIPILTLVTDLPRSGRIAYIGPDNRQAGRAAGELMGRFLGSAGGDILVILGMHRFVGHEEREMGFRQRGYVHVQENGTDRISHRPAPQHIVILQRLASDESDATPLIQQLSHSRPSPRRSTLLAPGSEDQEHATRQDHRGNCRCNGRAVRGKERQSNQNDGHNQCNHITKKLWTIQQRCRNTQRAVRSDNNADRLRPGTGCAGSRLLDRRWCGGGVAKHGAAGER